MSIKVAIQGGAGSYHDQVAHDYFKDAYEPLHCQTFKEVFAALEQGQAAKGVVASGNTIFGPITEVHELLGQNRGRIRVVDETGMPIHHCLIGLPGARLDEIAEVHSQDVALAQCRHFLQTSLPQANLVAGPDTAGSVALIKQRGNPHVAAIASEAAARHYGLSILRQRVEDVPGNYTTFLVIELAPSHLANVLVGRPNGAGTLR